MALGSLTAKTFAVRVLRRFGYRNTLVGVTACIGLMIAQFSLQTPSLPLWMLILPMILLGMAMSTQFTAMNSITLGDLAQEHVSTGNSLLAVTQQLSISFGVASSTAVLRLFNALAPGSLLDHFMKPFSRSAASPCWPPWFFCSCATATATRCFPAGGSAAHPPGSSVLRGKGGADIERLKKEAASPKKP